MLSGVFNKLRGVLPFMSSPEPLVTVIALNGIISDGGGLGRKGLSLARVEQAIEAAFKPENLKAVALAINSPGGSPVQSRLIHNAIRREAARRNVPVLAFIEDLGASGGYILALAGDEIYADESSIVGSIGVISAGFGFHEAISRLGVERRVLSAGENKSQLDPFQPKDPEDIARFQSLLDEMHELFINMVKERRGDGKVSGDDTFSGAFWSAQGAQDRGLIDGKAQLGDFLRTRYGDRVKIKRVAGEPRSLFRRLMGSDGASIGGAGIGVSAIGASDGSRGLVDPEAAIEALEARALWARFGR